MARTLFGIGGLSSLVSSRCLLPSFVIDLVWPFAVWSRIATGEDRGDEGGVPEPSVVVAEYGDKEWSASSPAARRRSVGSISVVSMRTKVDVRDALVFLVEICGVG